MIRFQTGIKYQIYEYAEYELRTDLTITRSFTGRFYGVNKDTRTLHVNAGFAWDGATMFPDFNWILESSLWHDVLHLLIAKGVIPESENNKIDYELAYAIRALGGPEARDKVADTLLKIRASYVRKATHLVNQKVTVARPVYELKQGRRWRVS